MAFATKAVELSSVAEDLLAYVKPRVRGADAWLVAVPLEGREALRFIAATDVHVPLLFTIEPMAKGVLGRALTGSELVRHSSGEAGAWYEHELGDERMAAPVVFEGETVAAVAAYGRLGMLSLDDEHTLRTVCDEAASAMGAAFRLSAAQEELAALRRLLDAVGGFLGARESEDLVGRVLVAAVGLCSAETGSVMLYDPVDETLRIAAATHLPEQVVRETRVKLGEGISGWVAQCGAGTVINDVESRRATRTRPTRSAVCVPMVSPSGTLHGVLNVGTTKMSGVFSDVDVGRLSTLAGYAAQALERLKGEPHRP